MLPLLLVWCKVSGIVAFIRAMSSDDYVDDFSLVFRMAGLVGFVNKNDKNKHNNIIICNKQPQSVLQYYLEDNFVYNNKFCINFNICICE